MLRLHRNFVCGLTLAGAFASSAFAQVEMVTERIEKAQELRANGNIAQARAELAALLRDVKAYPADGRRDAIILDNAGITEQDAGNYAEAENAFNSALTALHSGVSDTSIEAALTTHLAELYIAEQRSSEAEPLLRRTAANLRSAATPDPAALALAYNDLAVVSILKRKLTEAETFLRQAQGIIEADLGPRDPAIASTLLTFSGLLIAEHHYAEAVAPAERAWQILHERPVPGPYMAGVCRVISVVYLRVGRTAEAESYARRAVDLSEAAYGTDSPQVALYLQTYASVLKSEERKKQARVIQSRADAILANAPASTGGYTVNVHALR